MDIVNVEYNITLQYYFSSYIASLNSFFEMFSFGTSNFGGN